ncbi:hypothetical protein [Mangrovibacillus cuniculi]|uniref:Metal-dependent hydrolase n=1 Tax=Mangrovibacillus cuniculi TaxID=2593652 RepID=A0A7S8HGN5_9BACI|nr:hypothetical protein [Mangrovibacillus cuniculi]QPC47615.1 metal-dependent hydrolase [Mangrovibacillus cuniculi]
MLLLFLHVLSHALVGALTLSFTVAVVGKKELTWKEKCILMFFGGVAGIFPDLLGNRTFSYWTHAIVFSPIIALPIGLLVRFVLTHVTFIVAWMCNSLAVIFGHLLYDSVGHGAPLIYPFSKEQISLHYLELGDPWFLTLLCIMALSFLLSSHRIWIYKVAAIVAILFLSFKGVSKYWVEQQVEAAFALTEPYNITVYPPDEYLMTVTNPLDWAQWSFDIFSEQRYLRGYASLIGTNVDTHVNQLFEEKGEIVEHKGRYHIQLAGNVEECTVVEENVEEREITCHQPGESKAKEYELIGDSWVVKDKN